MNDNINPLLTQNFDFTVDAVNQDIHFSHDGLNLWWKNTRDKLIEAGVEIILGTGPTIAYMEQENQQVSGYFGDRPKKVLACATGKNDPALWLTVLIHEACHFQQYIENANAWKNVFVIHPETKNEIEATDVFFEWVDGKEHDDTFLKHCFNAIIEVESDCEKRTIDEIEKYNLPINTKNYAKNANAYVQSYRWVLENRKWYPDDMLPYESQEIIKSAPSVVVKEWPEEMKNSVYNYYQDFLNSIKKKNLSM